MADFDYFYQFENFIGYTGDLSDYPTLYFVGDGYYGRITTRHGNPKNVGRAAPKLLYGYTSGNRSIHSKGENRFFERNTRFGTRHTSRNTLTECRDDGVRARVKAMVLYWISKCEEVKLKDDEYWGEFVPIGPDWPFAK